MQDNHNHINQSEEAFLNDSWEKMAALLEAEMPAVQPGSVAQRKYRYSALLFLLLFIGSLTWLLINVTENTTQQQPDPLAPKGKAVVEAYAVAPNAMTAIENKEVVENLPGNAETPIIIPAHPVVAESEASLTLSAMGKQPAMVSPLTTPLSIRISNNSFHKNEALSSEKDNITLTNNIEPLDLPELAINNLITVPVEVQSNHHPILEGNAIPEKSLRLPQEKDKTWTYGLMAGVQQEKINQGFGGFAISAVVNRKLAKNFSLEGGLSFSWTQFNNSQLNNAPTTLNPNVNSNNNQNGIAEYLTTEPFNLSDANQPEPIQFGSATWLSLPVMLTYQPGRRWRVNMGVEYAQLLQAKEQKIIGNAGAKGDITNLIAENNISALTGVTWMMQKNLALDIRYQYGFTDLSKVNPKYIEQTDTRAALQWSVLYYFNAK